MPKFSPILWRLLRAAPCCAFSVPALATVNDSLLFSASINASHDSNIFRISRRTPARAVLGRDSAEDTIRSATGSVSFSKDYGLQHVDLNLSAVRYDYQNFAYLGFTALNYSGGARWSLTPRFHGNLQATRKETQINFGDFQSFGVQSKRTEVHTRADAVYELDGAWQLVAGVAHLDIDNSAPVVTQRGYTLTGFDAGVRRTWGSNSQATWRLRQSTGEFTGASRQAGSALPARFDENESELALTWTLTPKTVVDTRLSYVQRRHNEYTSRDYAGLVSRTQLQWALSAQTGVLVSYAHEILDYQTVYSSYFASDRLVVAPSWQALPKLVLTFRQEYAQRQFKGPLPSTVVDTGREDRQTLSRLGATWTPRDAVEISTWLQSEKRRSNYTGFDYASRSFGVLAKVTF
ncbi:outer membrane beta-barrel protein [Xylophilus sp. Kf1]|nr:outer membrane beta-barrel protein [Xylophilus sp. Kf1]